MTRDEAIALLLGGEDGIRDWNRRRETGEEIPDLSGEDLSGADLSGADLSGLNLAGAHLYEADFSWSNLSWSNLTGSNLSGSNLTGSNLSGSNLTGAHLGGSNLTEADLSWANLSGAPLYDADLSWANLSGANLTDADLREATLYEANLSQADFSRADLTGSNLTRAHLTGADLTGSNFTRAHLTGADLTGSNLTRANLTRANLSGADLTGSNLTGSNLTLARLFRADLTRALVEDAIVQDAQPFQLRGLPIPARVLRLGSAEPYIRLTGDEAKNFFVLPAVVEVFLTRTLADAEFGFLHIHLGDVHAQRVAPDVYLVGHRREVEGSVLRFQGPTYDAVYEALPDLLATFRTSKAIDWKKTLEAASKDERDEALTALVKMEARLKAGRWRLAEHLADAFAGFADARVVKLVEGRKKGVAITVFSDEALLENLARASLASIPTIAELLFRKSGTHDAPGTEEGGGDTFIINGPVTGTALGRSAHVTSEQITANNGQAAEILPDTNEPPGVKP